MINFANKISEKMNENEVKVNSLKAWMLATRPKTLIGAAVPVMIGTAMALRDSGWNINVCRWCCALLLRLSCR